jgi:hypothetical protein
MLGAKIKWAWPVAWCGPLGMSPPQVTQTARIGNVYRQRVVGTGIAARQGIIHPIGGWRASVRAGGALGGHPRLAGLTRSLVGGVLAARPGTASTPPSPAPRSRRKMLTRLQGGVTVKAGPGGECVANR